MRNTVTSLSPMRLASKLCTIGAGIILALGLTLIVIFYVLNNTNNGPDAGPGRLITLFVSLIIAMLAVFFALVIYAIGALLGYLSTQNSTSEESIAHLKIKSTPEEDDMQLEITPLPKMQ
jgi:hypothetical protein